MSDIVSSSYSQSLAIDGIMTGSQFLELAISGELWSEPRWLYALGIIPIIWVLYLLFFVWVSESRKYTKFADKHLLPYLLINNNSRRNRSLYSGLILWSLIWSCLTLAMAGPRWNYREFEAYSKEQNMVVLLDMSLSMNASDAEPSRFQRARQEIEDILNTARARSNSKIKIGLVGFAAHSHMISPISEDYSNIIRLLPILSTDLIAIQGTRLSGALKTAAGMLDIQSGHSKSILIISDGGFEDNASAFDIIAGLHSKAVIIHTMGIGGKGGINFINPDGSPLVKNGSQVITKLEDEKLKEAAHLGGGRYFDASILGESASDLIDILNENIDYLQSHEKTIKDWDEEFYIFLLPVVFLGLFWFRQGLVFPFIILILIAPYSAGAVDILDRLTLNDEHYAKKALIEDNDTDTALEYFDHPYYRGIAYYRAGDFEKAEAEFKKDQNSEYQLDSLYNLGNALAKQGKYEEASKVYNEVLAKDQGHKESMHNLELMQRILAMVKLEPEEDDNKKKNNSDDQSNLPEGGGGGGGGDDSEDESEGGNGSDDDGGDDKDSGDKKDDDKDGGAGDEDQPDGSDKDKGDKGGGEESVDGKDSGDNDAEGQGGSDQDSKGNHPDESVEKDNKGDTGDGDKNGKAGIDTNEWLNRIQNDYRNFLANQFYLESHNQKSDSDNNIDPW